MSSQHHSSLGIEILTPRGSVAKIVAPPHVSIRPVSIGTEAEVEIQGEGIAPEHLFILLREGRLLATSPVALDDPWSKRMKPAMLLGPSFRLVLSTAWTTADLPCRVELGDITVRLFWCSARKLTPPITPALPKTKTPLPMVRPPPKRPLFHYSGTLGGFPNPPPVDSGTLGGFPNPPPVDSGTLGGPNPPPVDSGTLGGFPNPPHESRTDRARREEALLREDDTTAARPDAPKTVGADTDAAAASFDQDPTVKRKRNGDGLSDAYDIPTPAHQKMPLSPAQLSGRVTPIPPPPQPLPRVFVHTPPGGNPHPQFQQQSESSLFKIATKAVDAWNRWVDDLDATHKRR